MRSIRFCLGDQSLQIYPFLLNLRTKGIDLQWLIAQTETNGTHREIQTLSTEEILLPQEINNSRKDQIQTLEKVQDLLPTQEFTKRIHQELASHPCLTFNNRKKLREFQDSLSILEATICQAQASWTHGTKFQSNSSKSEETQMLSLKNLQSMTTKKDLMTWCFITLKSSKNYCLTTEKDSSHYPLLQPDLDLNTSHKLLEPEMHQSISSTWTKFTKSQSLIEEVSLINKITLEIKSIRSGLSMISIEMEFWIELKLPASSEISMQLREDLLQACNNFQDSSRNSTRTEMVWSKSKRWLDSSRISWITTNFKHLAQQELTNGLRSKSI